MQNALTAIMGALSIASWIRMRKINFAFNNTKIKQTDSLMVILLIGSLFIVMYSQVIILILMLFVYRKEIVLSSNWKYSKNSVEYITRLIIHAGYYLLLIWPLVYCMGIISKWALQDASEQSIVSLLRSGNTEEKLLIMVNAIIIAPVLEELYFRKMLYGKAKFYLGIMPSIILISAIFALIHKSIYAFMTLFTLSILLFIIREYTNRIIYPICVHSGFNCIMVIQITT